MNEELSQQAAVSMLKKARHVRGPAKGHKIHMIITAGEEGQITKPML